VKCNVSLGAQPKQGVRQERRRVGVAGDAETAGWVVQLSGVGPQRELAGTGACCGGRAPSRSTVATAGSTSGDLGGEAGSRAAPQQERSSGTAKQQSLPPGVQQGLKIGRCRLSLRRGHRSCGLVQGRGGQHFPHPSCQGAAHAGQAIGAIKNQTPQPQTPTSPHLSN